MSNTDITPDTKNEERLQKIFTNVTDWLKFAETKNSMLIAFDGAAIFGFVQLLNIVVKSEVTNGTVTNTTLGQTTLGCWFVGIGISQLVFSAALSLCSFVPRLKMVKGGLFSGEPYPNVLFFEYLKTRTAIQILEEIYGENDKKYSKYETDLAEQIFQIADIASAKYSFFTIAVWLTISAFITPIVGAFLAYHTYKAVLFNNKKK